MDEHGGLLRVRNAAAVGIHDGELLRFLRAVKGDAALAQERVAKTAAWRAENAGLLQQPEADPVLGTLLSSLGAVDDGEMTTARLPVLLRHASPATSATSLLHSGPMTAVKPGSDSCSSSHSLCARPSTQPTERVAVTMVWFGSSSSYQPSVLSLRRSTVWCTWSHASRTLLSTESWASQSTPSRSS